MSTQVQRRRGTTVEHSTFTGAAAELTIDTTKNTAVIHDGVTAGGYPLVSEQRLASSATGLGASLVGIEDAAALFTATEVEGALAEVQTNLANHLVDAVDAHDASAISVLDTGGRFVSTDVEGALAEAYDAATSTSMNYFSEARNTTAPNATIPVHQWAVTGAETNIDITLSSKGVGAVLAQIPDNTTTGGNKRGNNAVDFQMSRAASTNVASGPYSVLGGGQNSTASGNNSTVLGGTNNISSGTTSSCGGGAGNTASGNTSTVSGGNSNTASGSYSTIPGGRTATTRGLYARYSYSAGSFLVNGDAQIGTLPLRISTTDATPTILTSDAGAASTTNVNVLPDNHAYTVVSYITARNTSTGDMASWKIEGAVKRGAGVATTALVGTPAITTIAMDAGASTWVVAMVANTTRGSVEIQVTGVAATTIHWMCKMDTVEVG